MIIRQAAILVGGRGTRLGALTAETPKPLLPIEGETRFLDLLLRHVARLIETQVRQIGWAARVGGDEFAVVLPGCTHARGLAVAEQLRAALQDWEPAYQGRSFTLGASIGVVMLDTGLANVTEVLHAADMACYAAKRAGRNRVVEHAQKASAV